MSRLIETLERHQQSQMALHAPLDLSTAGGSATGLASERRPARRSSGVLPNVKLSLPTVIESGFAEPIEQAAIRRAAEQTSSDSPATLTMPPQAIQPLATPTLSMPSRWPVSDTIRELRDNLLGELPATGGLLSVFFSPEPVSQPVGFLLPLAAAIAQRLVGEVLLIDTFGAVYGPAAPVAATQWRDILTAEVRVQSAIAPTRLPQVSVLRAGGGDEVLASDAWQRWPVLLTALRQRYRAVVMHGPSWQTWPRQLITLTSAADGAHPIISLGRTSHQSVLQSVRMLRRQSRARLSSIVAA